MSSKTSSRDKYVDFLVERFSTLGVTTARSMFGGYGFYCGGVFFAIYDKQHVYLKVDEQTRPAFAERGLPAFQPFEDPALTMKYHRAPAEMLEDDESLRAWAGAAIEVARRASRPKSSRKRATASRAKSPRRPAKP